MTVLDISPVVASAKLPAEFYLDVVVRSGLDVSIADAITAGEIERTMDGASTLTLTLFDPHRALLRNPDLARKIDMRFGGQWWRLVKVAKSGDNLTLTFEDRAIAYLRTHDKARKASRDTVTRAQFIRQLVREVGQRPKGKRSKNRPTGQQPIPFVCPELNVVQPIGDDDGEGSGGGTVDGKRKSVLYVGDSLAEGTIPGVHKTIPKTPLLGDGLQNRTSTQALAVLRSKLKDSHTTVVFDAGTNDDPSNPSAYRANLDDVKTEVGSRRLIVFTLNRGGSDMSGMNAEIRDFAKQDGVTLIDWGKIGDPYLTDGTHPNAKGYARRAKMVATAVGRGTPPKAPTRRKPATREHEKQAGLNPKANLTVKGVRRTDEQFRNGERVLDVADELKAGPKATLALMEAVIVESTIKNLTTGDRDSIGILQVRVGLHGREVAASIEKSVTAFLTKGFTGKGGAISLARNHPERSAAQIAQDVQGSDPAVYGNYAAEAQKWVDAYGGAGGSDTGGTADRGSSRSKKKYEFRRGEPGKREDSWTAIQRLADEVQWHAFMDKGRLYYVSDDWLKRQKPRFVIDEDDDGVLEINFDIDQGKVNSDVSVSARAEVFQVPVGCVIEVQNCGVANGRYLVTTVHQSVYDTACDITLRAPTPKLPEPEAEDAESKGSQGGDDTKADTSSSGSLRDRIIKVAEASAANYRKNPGAWHYLAGGPSYYQDPTKPPKPGTRSDCSHWVCCVYKKAGAPPPGTAEIGATGTMAAKGREVPLSQAKPGDIILYGSPPYHHVELFTGPGQRTLGHGSPPVDPGTVGMQASPHCWRYDFLD